MLPSEFLTGPLANFQVSTAHTVGFAPEKPIQSELAKSLSKVCSCFDAERCVIRKTELILSERGRLAQVVRCASNMDKPLGETDLTALWRAVATNETAVVERILLHENLDPNAKSRGETALHVAARMARTESIVVLLNDPRIDTKATNDKGRTAFEEAAERGKLNVINTMTAHPNAGISDEQYEKLHGRALEQQIALEHENFDRRERIADVDRRMGHHS